jgi:hypothetical protein
MFGPSRLARGAWIETRRSFAIWVTLTKLVVPCAGRANRNCQMDILAVPETSSRPARGA